MKITILLVVASTLLFVAGCASPDTHEADRGLEGTLRSEIDQRHVDIDVHHGIVHLEGHVPTASDRRRIDALVRSTPGVVAVKNELRVTLPSPGVYGANPAAIPVYPGPWPEGTPPAVAVTPPAAVVIPEYPKVQVQAWSLDDQAKADQIVHELRAAVLPPAGIEHVTIEVKHGKVALKGLVDTEEARRALISAVEQVGGLSAIYDELQVG